ncbi:MAG: DUF4105 domain-containing protein [Luteolibacter sp.]|uniref:Lnb N-terminal periplasmic domain-containing protein n=1 Tax=Luteolibacter sp. TaxID=1962973 RepID=UPI00326663B1
MAVVAVVIVIALAWAYGALHFDGPSKALAMVQVVAILAVFIFVKRWCRKLSIFGLWFAIVLAWWLSLKPTNVGDWQDDVAQLPWAEVDGDEVILHNVRNCEYRTESNYTARWEDRTVRLSKITHVDMAICYWGSPWMAHPILSFQFEDAPPLCFSIETRYKVGQSYSAIGGLYRQFELVYIAADERDIIRVRTNYRKNEDVYLFRLTAGPAECRERFREYVRSINALRDHPRWYNAITTNCTTAIRHQHPAAERSRWDWRMLVNGKGDELMYERHNLVTDGLSFTELKQRALINPTAKAAGDSPDFSALIRAGRPGMEVVKPAETDSAVKPDR